MSDCCTHDCRQGRDCPLRQRVIAAVREQEDMWQAASEAKPPPNPEGKEVSPVLTAQWSLFAVAARMIRQKIEEVI